METVGTIITAACLLAIVAGVLFGRKRKRKRMPEENIPELDDHEIFYHKDWQKSF